MPGSFCTVCRVRIESGSRCSRHRTSSPSREAWRQPGAQAVRTRVLDRDYHRCVRCGSTAQLEVHHLRPAAAGGATAPLNLITVCAECHRQIEREERESL